MEQVRESHWHGDGWLWVISSADQAEIVVHQGPDGEDVRGVHPRAHDLEPDLVILLYHHVLVRGLVAGRVGVGVEAHVGGDAVSRDEAGQGADLGEEANFVNLGHHRVQNLAFERPEHITINTITSCVLKHWGSSPEYDGFVFDRVEDEPLARLNEASSNIVDGGHRYHEPILSCNIHLHWHWSTIITRHSTCAGSLHLREQFLFDCVHQLRPEVSGVKHDFMVQRYVIEHGHKADKVILKFSYLNNNLPTIISLGLGLQLHWNLMQN